MLNSFFQFVFSSYYFDFIYYDLEKNRGATTPYRWVLKLTSLTKSVSYKLWKQMYTLGLYLLVFAQFKNVILNYIFYLFSKLEGGSN